MRKLIAGLALVAILTGSYALAQQATLSAPVPRASEDNLAIASIFKTRDGGGRWEIYVSVRDSGGNEIRRQSFTGPDAGHAGATLLALQTAERNARGGETGGISRTSDFRVLGFLFDNAYIGGILNP